MDELELLKKDWQRKEKDLPKLSFDDIYKMIWKKSSSVVKWIYYISIGELLIGILLNFFLTDKEYWQKTKDAHLAEITIITTIISFVITFYFIYKFYKNYKAISVTDDAKTLMENILKTRKTVKNYIKVVLIFTAVTSMTVIIFSVFNDPAVIDAINEKTNGHPSRIFWAGIVLLTILATGVILLIFWLFYQLLYGILLRKLNYNYQELKKMEL
ncbi:hypothetical protein [Abyssalbus ytuae]|uniref:Uncharacterized protein n=1 Tax=Abyssalbus ytuae TaxID=2926907 RepID=A0A9E6ZPB3_9FLAO|nr:hypothetical protein [Abyssalbus ytuae]UOB18035.1 hypothetical protein MQE35_01745 [Abyssalbus ytuae]